VIHRVVKSSEIVVCMPIALCRATNVVVAIIDITKTYKSS
jgi:hypothetical protein